MKYPWLVPGLVVGLLTLMPSAGVFADAGSRANAICGGGQIQYSAPECKQPGQYATERGKTFRCLRNYHCQESNDKGGRMIGTCQWQGGKGVCTLSPEPYQAPNGQRSTPPELEKLKNPYDYLYMGPNDAMDALGQDKSAQEPNINFCGSSCEGLKNAFNGLNETPIQPTSPENPQQQSSFLQQMQALFKPYEDIFSNPNSGESQTQLSSFNPNQLTPNGQGVTEIPKNTFSQQGAFGQNTFGPAQSSGQSQGNLWTNVSNWLDSWRDVFRCRSSVC